jgi:choline transporter-like protein 2/4/5
LNLLSFIISLMRNIVRVVVLNKVVAFLLFLGKIAIVTGVGTMSYFVFSRQIPDLVKIFSETLLKLISI